MFPTACLLPYRMEFSLPWHSTSGEGMSLLLDSVELPLSLTRILHPERAALATVMLGRMCQCVHTESKGMCCAWVIANSFVKMDSLSNCVCLDSCHGWYCCHSGNLQSSSRF